MIRIDHLARIGLAAALLAIAGTAQAYETYNGGCQGCHGAFTDGRAMRGQTIRFGNKHDMHRNGNGGMQADCALCHIGRNKDPLIGESDGTASNPGLGCTGCHRAPGLRAHHAVSGIGICANCHRNDPAPQPEDSEPRYYGTPDTRVDRACNVTATESLNENWTVGDFIGLDNDGDGLYDADDPDCADQLPQPSAPVAKAGTDSFAVDRDNSGTETVTLDGSQSTDADADIVSYVWRENGEIIAQGVTEDVDLGVGLHTIQLTVTDEGGLTGTDKVKIRVFAKPANLATTVRDANGNSSGDFVLALLDDGAGRFTAYVRDGADGSAIRKIALGTLELRLMATLRDISGNGRDELTVLGITDAGEMLVRLFDTGNRELLRKMKFPKTLEPFALLPLDDRLGGLGGRAVALVQTGQDGQVQAQVRDAATGNKINTLLFSKAYAPVGAAAVRDINKNSVDDIAIIGVHADGRVRAQLLDAATGEQLARHFFDKRFPPVLIGKIPSINGNPTDELVVLGINDAGKVRAQVLDSKSGKQLALVIFDRDYAPLAMSYVDHPDGPALAVLGENAVGKRRTRTKLLGSGQSVGVVGFPADIAADNLIPLEDMDGSGVSELLLSGELGDGRVRALAKDAAAGTELFRKTLP